MIIRNGEHISIELSFRDAIPNETELSTDMALVAGSEVHLDVAVRCGNYTGWTDVGIWIGDWESFLSSLTEFEQTRRGEVELTMKPSELRYSMVPGEFRLRLYATDTAGHLAIEGEIGEHVSDQMPVKMVNLRFDFELDPEFLPSILSDFRKLVP